MKLNLKFYNGNDAYSDGDIEDKIIEYIKKYPDNYEEAFKEDSSWPVFYHLSDMRKNVIRWYPFEKNSTILEVGAGMGAITDELCRRCKKVTSIELSKKRATAILERNKNAKNLEIIVGNYNDIVLKEKYDYILLNGVLEYGKLYMNSENPYEDFINKLKLNLKSTGKILVAIENRFGLKYWCGANEDHTNIPFDSIQGYKHNKNIVTFSKYELEKLAQNCNLNINFYYLFPDYKFTKVVYTDDSIHKDLYTCYSPYYYAKMNLVINEQPLYEDIYKNNKLDFFANSFFVELSLNKNESKVKYAKFNNEYRKDKYNFCTLFKDNKFYKVLFCDDAREKIIEIKQIAHYLERKGINIVKLHSTKSGVYSNKVTGESLNSILLNLYEKHNLKEIYNIFDTIEKLIIKSCYKKMNNYGVTVFNKYQMKISKNELDKMRFYERGILDIIPSNIIVQEDNYVLIDQEWWEEKIPIEYVMYRAIFNTFYCVDQDIMQVLFNRYNINATIFEKLEEKFINSIKRDSFASFSKYLNNSTFIVNINELQNNYDLLLRSNSELQNNYDILKKNYSELQTKYEQIENEEINIINQNKNLSSELKLYKDKFEQILQSKRYRVISYIADLKNKVTKK